MSTGDHRHEGRLIQQHRAHNCPDCTDVISTVRMTLEFDVATLADFPSSNELVASLEEALPKEWFTANSGADWWVRNIDVG